MNAVTAPIFVVGSGRCGTTHVASILGRHPRIAHFPRESKFLHSFFGWLDEVSPEADDATARARRFISGWLVPYLRFEGKARILEKTPGNVHVVDRLGACFPDARFIDMYRDPRDVVTSLRRVAVKPDLETAARLWNRAQASALQAEEATEEGTILHVRYEGLVTDPAEGFRRMLKFLGEDPGPLRDLVREKTHERAVGRWRDVLTPEEVGVVESICGEHMRRLGYSCASS